MPRLPKAQVGFGVERSWGGGRTLDLVGRNCLDSDWDIWLGCGVRSAFKREPKEDSQVRSCHARTPTWQQVAVEVGPGLLLVWPGWTGHPQGTVPRSRLQGPRREAGGSGGGTLEQ